jgi:ribose transport system substrate-binding protein
MVAAGADVVMFFQPVESIGHIMADLLFRANIPFITVERPIQGGIYYGANNYQAGKMAGVALGRFAQRSWKSRFDGVVLVETARTSTNVQARVAGVLVGLREVLGEIEESQVVHLDGKAHLESSEAAMAELLKKIPIGKRLLISGFNDVSAVGALRAVRAARRESEVAIVGQNAAREGQMEIRRRNSRMIASVAYFPERYGPNLVRLAMEVAAGRQVSPAVYTEHLVLDRENIDRVYPETTASTCGEA